MEPDECRFLSKCLDQKHTEDMKTMEDIFKEVYCGLLNKIIRERYIELCDHCQGRTDARALCNETSGTYLGYHGSKNILDKADSRQKANTWQIFLAEVVYQKIFKKVIIDWLKRFSSVEEVIDTDITKYHDFMQERYPALVRVLAKSEDEWREIFEDARKIPGST